MTTGSPGMLASALKRWCDAILSGDPEAANIAEHIELYAQIVIASPEFLKRWQAECPHLEASEVLHALTIALKCITQMSSCLTDPASAPGMSSGEHPASQTSDRESSSMSRSGPKSK